MEGFPKNIPKIEKVQQEESKFEKPQIKEGVDFVFEQHPEISIIGTKEQYSEYLDSIFPESIVDSIVYHGGTLIDQDRGKDSFTGELGGKHGLYFTGSRSRAKAYIKSGSKDYQQRSTIHSILLDIKNPLNKKIWGRWKFGLDKISDKELQIIKDNNADGLIEKDFLSRFTQYNTQYVVLDMSQVFVLGSKNDTEAFKEFVKNKKS